MDDQAGDVQHDQRRVPRRRGSAWLALWVGIGAASAVLLVLNLRDGGWDTGTASNVLMLVASVAGVVGERARARQRPPG